MSWKASYDQLETTQEGPLARLTLNRPSVHNAFNAELIAAITDVLGRLADAPEIRVVVLAGAGKSFCAGGDIAWMRAMKQAGPQENLADARRIMAMFRALADLPKPTIARVHGAARGGGVGLAAACDLVVAARPASFALTEVRLGLSAATITPYVVRRIGEQATRRMMLTAMRIDAEQALRIGLADRVCGADELDACVDELAGEIVQGGPEALAAAKRVLDVVRTAAPDAIDEQASRILAERRSSDEGQEGLSAFLEKREPRWRS